MLLPANSSDTTSILQQEAQQQHQQQQQGQYARDSSTSRRLSKLSDLGLKGTCTQPRQDHVHVLNTSHSSQPNFANWRHVLVLLLVLMLLLCC
jgi:hypothetical protein